MTSGRRCTQVSNRWWIRIRLLGWSLILAWFILYLLNLGFHVIDRDVLDIANGVLGALGTFLVLIGYYMLTRENR